MGHKFQSLGREMDKDYQKIKNKKIMVIKWKLWEVTKHAKKGIGQGK